MALFAAGGNAISWDFVLHDRSRDTNSIFQPLQGVYNKATSAFERSRLPQSLPLGKQVFALSQ